MSTTIRTGTFADGQTREVTLDEAEVMFVNGWVKLPGLVSPELAAQMLAAAQELMGEDGERHRPRPGIDFEAPFQDYRDPSHDSELFRAVAFSEVLGHNAARLMGRDRPIRFYHDAITAKVPESRMPHRGGTVDWHQDTGTPLNRSALHFWIALSPVTPQNGGMQFISGSKGVAGGGPHALRGDGTLAGVYEAQPLLERCAVSEPMTLEPGDATAHYTFCVHSSPPNRADSVRWCFRPNYFYADTRWTGMPSHYLSSLGFKPGDTLDHTNHPIVYAPDGSPEPSFGYRSED